MTSAGPALEKSQPITNSPFGSGAKSALSPNIKPLACDGGTCCHGHGITAWDPSPSDLPPDYYLYEYPSLDSSGQIYIWSHAFPSTPGISSVLVAPPIDADNPYLLNTDYSGSYGTSLESSACENYVSLHLYSPGAYTVRVNFGDGSNYTEFLYAGDAPGNKGTFKN